MYIYIINLSLFTTLAVFTLDGGETKYMEGGDLATTTYRLVQFHFHWGGHSTVGSEHTFDSYRFPMEVNIHMAALFHYLVINSLHILFTYTISYI